MDVDHLRMETTLSTDSSSTLSPSPQPSTFNQPMKNGTEPSIPSYIPTKHAYRTLVLCFDGTGNQYASKPPPSSPPPQSNVSSPQIRHRCRISSPFGHTSRACLMTSIQNSNVVEFVSLLKKDDPSKQLVYYQVRLRCFPFDRWFG